ncbi:unnamed protein product, partial [Staurois parvus]
KKEKKKKRKYFVGQFSLIIEKKLEAIITIYHQMKAQFVLKKTQGINHLDVQSSCLMKYVRFYYHMSTLQNCA